MPWTKVWLKKEPALGFWKPPHNPAKASTAPTMPVTPDRTMAPGVARGPDPAQGPGGAASMLALASA